MNSTNFQNEEKEHRFGVWVAARLNEQALPHNISERLRVARQLALDQRKRSTATQVEAAHQILRSGSVATLGSGDGFGWWSRLAAAIALAALVIGLFAINSVTDVDRANELAEVDTLLLTDDLPPAAHTDPGFVQFLKFGAPASNE